MVYLIFVLSGLIVGSFLNVIILRFDDLKSILVGRSHCPHCKKNLLWYELIPVLSYVALRGKCSQCKKPISIQYPLVEIATALVFALLYWKFGLSSVALYFYLVIAAILIVVFVYDILEQQISDWFIITAVALWLLYLIINFSILHTPFSILLSSLYGALALGGFLGLMVLVSKEKWMGAGDIGLGALLGFLLGWPNILVGGFLAFFIGAVVGVVLMFLKRAKMQSQLPFAPFLILGFFIALFWGSQIINWYINLFFKV
jgi:leader peptidase (prepilin peptidase)/N-methyltransferase